MDTSIIPWNERPSFIQRWIDKRTGAERCYFRKGSGPKIALASPWGTQAMADEVAALVASIKPPPSHVTGTLVGAVYDYRGERTRGIPASADYVALERSTQRRYDAWLDRFEKIFVGVLLEDVTPAYVLQLRDAWAPFGHEAANTALQVFKNICKRHIIVGTIPENPFAMIERVPRPKGLGIRNPRWEDTEVDALLEYALKGARPKPGFARAIALGRYGGFRKQSICRISLRARIERTNASGAKERRLLWLTEKKEVLCDRREDIRLTELLSQTPNRALTIAYNSHGAPWTGRALSHELDRVLALLAKRGEVRDTLTMHGLRHARGVEIAYHGGSDAEIMAALDHATAKAAKEYREQADRLRLADNMQDKVDAEVIRLRAVSEARRQSGAS